jgi:hypothetical protein
MVDFWPHSQPHLRESDLLLKISHYTNCATGRSHASTVWPKKKLRLWVQIQILKLLLTIKLTQGSSRHIWRVRAFQLYLPGHLLSHHFGILPTYLPRDQFLPSELVVPLVAQCHQSTTVHSYGPSGELERHYAFIHPPLPRFRRNRDRLHEKSTQTCQATQTWIFYFRRLFDEDSELSEGLEHTELTLPLLDTDRCNKMIVTDTFYGNKQCNEE